MKKLLVLSIFSLSLVVTSGNAEATATTTATSTGAYSCTVINTNLCPDAPNAYCPSSLYKSGPTNDYKDFINKSWKPVSALQKFLKQAGYIKSKNITGTYDSVTKNAIAKFQKDYRITKDLAGFAGPSTRSYIKSLSCSKDQTLPDLDIVESETKVATSTDSLTVKLDFVVKNIGYDSASSTTVYDVTASGGTASIASSTCSISDLQPGSSCSVSYNVLFSKFGKKELRIRVDSKNKVKEINENNNSQNIKINLTSTGGSHANSGPGSSGGNNSASSSTTTPTISNIVVRNETAGKDVTSLNINPYYVGFTKTERQYHITWNSSGFTDEFATIMINRSGGTNVLSTGKIKVSNGRYDFSGATLRNALGTTFVNNGEYKLIVRGDKNGSPVTSELQVKLVKN